MPSSVPSNNPHDASASSSTGTVANVQLPRFNIAFPVAAQPDIIRANQKDLYYRTQLQEGIDYAFREALGTRQFLRYQSEIRTFSDFLYYILTTLTGSQTLGEEYCDLLQVDGKRHVYPDYKKRLLSILLQLGFPYAVTKGIDQFRQRVSAAERRIVSGQSNASPQDEKWAQLGRLWLDQVNWLWKVVFHPMHLALFYFAGAYYHFSKRLTGIRYIFTRQLAPNEEPMGYEFIGVLMVIQLIVRGAMSVHQRLTATTTDESKENSVEGVISATETAEQFNEDNNNESIAIGSEEIKEQANCALCLAPRQETTATPCGHMFCWLCICQWCQTKPECPLCRQPAPLSHLFVIHNT
ncbi:Pex12 amino terminal region-domain-containing protein [Syncephalis fuscata]|nr:Pex12 amino terminal region-domain-containing protein [Syncephalis fuscata]